MGNNAKHYNMTTLFWRAHFEIIRKAAENKRMQVADYVRSVILPAAERDSGIPLPRMPEFKKTSGARLSIVALAAESMGLTVQQFRDLIVERAAVTIVDNLTSAQPSIPSVPDTPRHQDMSMPGLRKGGR